MKTLKLVSSRLFFFFFFSVIFNQLQAEPVQQVNAQFVHLMSEINKTLSENQQDFVKDKGLFATFVDKLLIANWSAESTVKGLAGKSAWRQLTEVEKGRLVNEFNNTLQRYAQEGFDYYEGQRIEFISVKLNKQQNRGMLKVRVHPKILPSFDIDFKIKRLARDWKLYDVMVQGVSYIRLKRDSFRAHFNNEGVDGLLKDWKTKNKGYVPAHANSESLIQVSSAEGANKAS